MTIRESSALFRVTLELSAALLRIQCAQGLHPIEGIDPAYSAPIDLAAAEKRIADALDQLREMASIRNATAV